MSMENNRLHPPIWRNDAYTLRRLRESIEVQLDSVLGSSPNQTAMTTAVDIGAGSAPYRSLFTSRNVNYVPCDIAINNDLNTHGSVLIQPGCAIPLDPASADWVVSFQVLEHVWDLDWYLGEVKRLLKPRGHVLLSTHGTWLYHPHPTDYRRWTRDGLIREIEQRGFRVISVRADVGPLAWTTQFRTLAYHHVLKKIPVFGPILAGLLCVLMFVRMVAEDWITPDELKKNNAAVYTVLAAHSLTNVVAK